MLLNFYSILFNYIIIDKNTMADDWFWAKSSMIFIIFMLLILYFFLCAASVKFFKNYKWNFRCLVWFLIFLNFTLATRIISWAIYTVGYFIRWDYELPGYIEYMHSFPSQMFLWVAVTFHMFHWYFSVNRIESWFSHEQKEEGTLCILILSQWANLIIYLWVFAYLFVAKLTETYSKSVMVIAKLVWMVQWFTIAIAFSILGIKFISHSRKVNVTKWLKLRNKVKSSIILTVIALIIRGWYSFISELFDLKQNMVDISIKNDDWIFPVTFTTLYAFEDFFPILAQIIGVLSIISHQKKEGNNIL